jgi:ectoine hydroxylase-related dioxygenase (phytanoyl-CoA dioxygenase family)
MGECAARLMRSRTARIFHEHVLVKEPGNSMKTPWHQDQPYYLVDGRQSVSFWVPLDHVPRAISVEYVAGSHKWGKDFRPQRFDGTSLYQGDTSEAVPDVEAKREDWPVLGFDMAPGDAVAFDFRTLHGAPANFTPNRRRAISFRWVGDDAVFAQRAGRTSPPFPGLAFVHGAPFEGPDFPVVWPRG